MSEKFKVVDPFDLIKLRFEDRRPLSQIGTDEWAATLDAIFAPVVKQPDKESK